MDKDVAAYVAEARRWDVDQSIELRRSARRAWTVAAGAGGLAVLASGAIAALAPLKTVEPFVIRVDASTGVVDVVPQYAGRADLPEAVTRHLVTEYVVQRERYIPAIAESDYEQVGALHSAAMNQRWAAAWARTNPQSPLNRYSDGTHVAVQVQAVSFLSRSAAGGQTVQVRFLTTATHDAGPVAASAQYVATMEVAFGPPSSDVRLRALNPLGFKVLEYRREPEAVAAIASPPGGGGAL